MIVDASVAFKWFADEEGSEQALALIGKEPLFAPTLLLSEVGNALWKNAQRDRIDPDVSFESDLVSLSALLTIVDERSCVPRALTIARVLGHPIYDCIYLALAEMERQSLVTADRRFITRIRGTVWAELVEELS